MAERTHVKRRPYIVCENYNTMDHACTSQILCAYPMPVESGNSGSINYRRTELALDVHWISSLNQKYICVKRFTFMLMRTMRQAKEIVIRTKALNFISSNARIIAAHNLGFYVHSHEWSHQLTSCAIFCGLFAQMVPVPAGRSSKSTSLFGVMTEKLHLPFSLSLSEY